VAVSGSVPPDPVSLAAALIRCPSVTPEDAGAQDLLATTLEGLGFTVHRLSFGRVANLFAELGRGAPHFCFAGHTDVVPPGERALWSADPFGGERRDSYLYGRGAVDMKGAIAAFIAAAARHLAAHGTPRGTLSLLITGDEEGEARDGTARVLDWLAARGTIPDFCLVGEPTSKTRVGDTVKIGRRGSLNARIVIEGIQGHVAYPERADNPAHRLVALLSALTALPLDGGTAHFAPSTLQVTSIDIGNPATNVIPARAEARLNIRFNDLHRGADLIAWLEAAIRRYAERYLFEPSLSGEAFRTEASLWLERLTRAVTRVTGAPPTFDTGGGTSDARFIARFEPVAELGLVGERMHGIDERVAEADLAALTRLYEAVLSEVFGDGAA